MIKFNSLSDHMKAVVILAALVVMTLASLVFPPLALAFILIPVYFFIRFIIYVFRDDF